MKTIRFSKLCFFSIIMLLIIVFSLLMFGGCSKKASDYSEEEHIHRISERLNKKSVSWTYKDGSKPTGFQVYPLYDETEELKYCLVEYEPYGFVFVLVRDEQLNGLSCIGASTSMYKLSNLYSDDSWSPYTIDETNRQPWPDTDKCWKEDEDGNKIEYKRSPYYVNDCLQERKYLLTSNKGAEYVCAIKKNENFINLISSTEINIANGDLLKKQATLYVAFYAEKEFDL